MKERKAIALHRHGGEILEISAHPAYVRAVSPETRNPLLKLRAAHELRALLERNPETAAGLRRLLKALSGEARDLAQKSWKTHKAPMAAYWKAVAVYARHTSLVIKP